MTRQRGQPQQITTGLKGQLWHDGRLPPSILYAIDSRGRIAVGSVDGETEGRNMHFKGSTFPQTNRSQVRLQESRVTMLIVGLCDEILCVVFPYHGSYHQCEAFSFPKQLKVPESDDSTLLGAAKIDVETGKPSDGCEKGCRCWDVKSSKAGKFRLRLPLPLVDLFGVVDFARHLELTSLTRIA